MALYRYGPPFSAQIVSADVVMALPSRPVQLWPYSHCPPFSATLCEVSVLPHIFATRLAWFMEVRPVSGQDEEAKAAAQDSEAIEGTP